MSKQLMLVVNAVANEKNIDKEIIFQAMEDAISIATKKHLNNNDNNISVFIDRLSGNYKTYIHKVVLNDDSIINDENIHRNIILTEAQKISPLCNMGDTLDIEIHSIHFGRIAAQIAKQVILQKVREAERKKILDIYRNKMHKLFTVTIKKILSDHIILDIGELIEGILPKDNTIPRELLRIGDKCKVSLHEIKKIGLLEELIFSRMSHSLLIELFKLEVPEIREEIITIIDIVRDAGSRSKVSVKTNDGRVDPIGACIGVRGNRIHNISNALCGERIDIVLWNSDIVQYAINSLSPIPVSSIVVDQDNSSMKIAVKEEFLAQAIGKNGQNVKLSGKLLNWTLNIITENDASSKKEIEKDNIISLFVENLDIDKTFASDLVKHGFKTIEEIAYLPLSELKNINDNDIDNLKNNAKNYLLKLAFINNKT
jgi:N utilization substance protein A